MSKILVTGATGKLGSLVVNQLTAKENTSEISVLVRDLSKANALLDQGVNIIQGNYNDPDSLVKAFSGIDKLYFVSSSDIPNRFSQHENVVKAAVEAGVKHIVYTSAQRLSEDGSSPIALVADAHWKTDDLIKESGITYTLLKHGLYTDIIPMFIGDQVLETGTIYLPAGSGKSSFATRQNLAEAGAQVLTTEGHENKIYEFGGTSAYSFEEVADFLSELSGKKISYVSPTIEEYSETLKGYGLGEEMIQGAATFSAAIAEGEFNFPSQDLAIVLGRELESVKSYLKSAYKL